MRVGGLKRDAVSALEYKYKLTGFTSGDVDEYKRFNDDEHVVDI